MEATRYRFSRAQQTSFSEPLIVQPGVAPPPIEIILNRGGGTIRGTVETSSTLVAAGVLIVPSSPASVGPQMVPISLWEKTASFETPLLAPGEYNLYAFKQWAEIEYRSPEFLRALTGGVGVRVRDGEEQEVTITSFTRMKTAFAVFAIALTACAQSFPVSGVVIDAVNRAPMKRVRVTLAGSATRKQSVITGDDGRFAFEAPSGQYRLTAEYQGNDQTYGQFPGTIFAAGVFTGPDQDSSSLVFRWFPLGSISGTVIDDRGEPAPGVMVGLIRETIVGGRRQPREAGRISTNDIGQYRFGNLAAGTYELVVTGTPWSSERVQTVPKSGDTAPETRSAPTYSYAPAHYPNADANAASPLTLAPGQDAKADFTLRTVRGANVNVRAIGDVNITGARVMLLGDGVSGLPRLQTISLPLRQSQTFFAVPPSPYTLLAVGPGASLLGRKTIDVLDSELASNSKSVGHLRSKARSFLRARKRG